MKKFYILFVLVFLSVSCLLAKNDPFATKKFLGDNMIISFREQDSEGRPQVSFKKDSVTEKYYYNFDDNYIAFFDENDMTKEVFGYSFINNGSGLRLFNEDGKFVDFKSDDGKTTSDKVWESVNTVAQNFLIYGGSGTVIGAAFGGIGAPVGLAIGGVFGVGKALVHDIFRWI